MFFCKDLSVGYDKQAVLSGLSFAVNPGDYLCVIGENGTGKSTLIKTIIGLESPISGKAIYPSVKSGYVAQRAQVQADFPATVMEVVLSGLLSRDPRKLRYRSTDRSVAGSVLELLGISKLAYDCFRELSGGQQQRVLIARAMCATEKYLLMDEPAAGLDQKSTIELYETIASLNQDSGYTIILVTHDTLPLQDASHVLQLGDREMKFFGTVERFIEWGEHE